MRSPPLLRTILLGVLMALVFAAGPLSAHEVGGVKVTAVFLHDGSYRIDATFDLERLPRGAIPRLEECHVAFDGQEVPVHAAAAASPGDPSSKTLVLHLEGTVPAGASTFVWSHDAPAARYLFGTRHEEDGSMAWQWIDGKERSEPVALRHAPPPLTRSQTIRLYLKLGFTHILPRGLDHILFVLGLFLLSLKPRTILLQVTTFTLAHSITLGLTIYGFVSLSPKIVEPLIALSIVYVAVENVIFREVKPWRLVVVFCFGLLHGMGFAGVLRELGLPRSEFLTALVSFNLGVEGGQLTVIGLAFLAVGVWFGRKPWYRAYVTVPASAVIALVGLYWTVQRIFF